VTATLAGGCAGRSAHHRRPHRVPRPPTRRPAAAAPTGFSADECRPRRLGSRSATPTPITCGAPSDRGAYRRHHRPDYEGLSGDVGPGRPESQLACVLRRERIRLGAHQPCGCSPGCTRACGPNRRADAGRRAGRPRRGWHRQRPGGRAVAGWSAWPGSTLAWRDYVAGHDALASRGDGGALAYLIETPEGHCSTRTRRVTGRRTGPAPPRRRHPGGDGNAATSTANPSRDPGGLHLAQAELAQARPAAVGHHDYWMPGLTSRANTAPVRESAGGAQPGVELVEIGYRYRLPACSTPWSEEGKHEERLSRG